jgi:ketosteroid isomerase-like protein
LTNKEIIREVNKSFMTKDLDGILKHVADDVQWDMPGAFSHKGKEAFGKEASNAFIGKLEIKSRTEVAEGDHVVVEGEVEAQFAGSKTFKAVFLDIYRLENGKIKEMRSYVIPEKK